jgi:transcriptional regulator with XRE-family HTH domain
MTEPAQEIQEAVGWRIRAARERHGWSQTQLAKRLDCTQTAVSYWESGSRALGVVELIEVAEALGVPPDTLLPGPDEPGPSDLDERIRRAISYAEGLSELGDGGMAAALRTLIDVHVAHHGHLGKPYEDHRGDELSLRQGWPYHPRSQSICRFVRMIAEALNVETS